jgi:hypothetical protein
LQQQQDTSLQCACCSTSMWVPSLHTARLSTEAVLPLVRLGAIERARDRASGNAAQQARPRSVAAAEPGGAPPQLHARARARRRRRRLRGRRRRGRRRRRRLVCIPGRTGVEWPRARSGAARARRAHCRAGSEARLHLHEVRAGAPDGAGEGAVLRADDVPRVREGVEDVFAPDGRAACRVAGDGRHKLRAEKEGGCHRAPSCPRRGWPR